MGSYLLQRQRGKYSHVLGQRTRQYRGLFAPCKLEPSGICCVPGEDSCHRDCPGWWQLDILRCDPKCYRDMNSVTWLERSLDRVDLLCNNTEETSRARFRMYICIYISLMFPSLLSNTNTHHLRYTRYTWPMPTNFASRTRSANLPSLHRTIFPQLSLPRVKIGTPT